MRQSLTFREVLQTVEDANAQRVAARAVLCNRIAKVAHTPRARRSAYAAKTRAMEHGIAKFPADYGLSSVEEAGRILGVRFRRRCVRHVRRRDLSVSSLRWLDAEGRKVAAEMKTCQAA
jgi:hypothetical protein